MTRVTDDVVAARIAAERARERLMESAQALQARLSPRLLATQAWQGAKDKGADLAERSVDAVRERPAAAAGIAAALALFLARKPIANLAGRMFDDPPEDEPNERSTETA